MLTRLFYKPPETALAHAGRYLLERGVATRTLIHRQASPADNKKLSTGGAVSENQTDSPSLAQELSLSTKSMHLKRRLT
jgi:hypothetical protein